MTDSTRRWAALLLSMFCGLAGCAKTSAPQASRETNWLLACESDGQCIGSSECVCGVCSRACSDSAQCGSGVRCQPRDSTLVSAACADAPSVQGLCAPECTRRADCAAGQDCVQGACAPLPELDAGLLGTDAGP